MSKYLNSKSVSYIRVSHGLPMGAQWLRTHLQCRRHRRHGLILQLEDPMEEEMATHSRIPEKFMDGGGWWSLVHGVAKSQTGLSY